MQLYEPLSFRDTNNGILTPFLVLSHAQPLTPAQYQEQTRNYVQSLPQPSKAVVSKTKVASASVVLILLACHVFIGSPAPPIIEF